MYTADALLDLHERAHQSLQGLIAHCRQVAAGDLERQLAGFGYPSVRLQFVHVIGAEEYWIGVLEGRIDADDKDALYTTLDAIEGWRAAVSGATGRWLRAAMPGPLNTARAMQLWGGREQVLMPARVVLRTVTHLFHHQGQVVAMCRLLGVPAPGFDLPIA